MSVRSPKVQSLHGEPIPSLGEPNVDLVEHLEWLLDRAEAGEVIGLAYAIKFQDRSVGDAIVMPEVSAADVGAAACLAQRLATTRNDDKDNG